MAFQKGKSGNPFGRPKGAKDKLTNIFWTDVFSVWELGGRPALEKVMADDPSTFVRVVASLMPKEVDATVRTINAQQLGDDELANIAVGGGDGATDAPFDPQVTH